MTPIAFPQLLHFPRTDPWPPATPPNPNGCARTPFRLLTSKVLLLPSITRTDSTGLAALTNMVLAKAYLNRQEGKQVTMQAFIPCFGKCQCYLVTRHCTGHCLKTSSEMSTVCSGKRARPLPNCWAAASKQGCESSCQDRRAEEGDPWSGDADPAGG